MDLTAQLSSLRYEVKRICELDVTQDGRRVDPESTSSSVQRLTPGRQAQCRLKLDEVVSLIAAYESGTSVTQLAVEFGVHRNTVTGHLQRNGVPIRLRGRERIDVVEAAELYELGWSLAQLGVKYGVDAETMRTALRDTGTTIRPRAARRKL